MIIMIRLIILIQSLLEIHGIAIGAPPLLLSTQGSHRFDRLIHSVVRKTNEPDIIHPTVCPPSCEHLHQAINHIKPVNFTSNLTIEAQNRINNAECSCSCPPTRPIYLSSAGSCVDRLHECQKTITWKSRSPTEVYVPVVHLFPHSVVLLNSPLDFEGADIKILDSGAANCTITRIFYENIHHRWKAPPRKTALFELTDLDGRPIIYFRGTEFDASFLSGAVVQIKMKCETNMERMNVSVDNPDEFCVSIRIAGVSGSPSFSDTSPSDFDEPGWRIEMVILAMLIIFIIVVILVTLSIWNVCWKMKKRKLISDFQMQFIQQYRNRHDGKYSPNGMAIEDIDVDEGSMNMAPVSNRRRLYFSQEYFDRENLENPPPMAEQFLYDLRRMVDVAKDRIRQRRFAPNLHAIDEEEAGSDNDSDNISLSSPESQPKSVDSGRESRDSEEEEEEEEEKNTNVLEIVKNIEKSISRPSQLPVPLNSRRKSAGDRPTSRQPISTGNAPTIAERRTEFESKIRPPSTVYGGRSLKERKGYTVFPSDGTFNKSLPRRPKKFVPATPNAQLST